MLNLVGVDIALTAGATLLVIALVGRIIWQAQAEAWEKDHEVIINFGDRGFDSMWGTDEIRPRWVRWDARLRRIGL